MSTAAARAHTTEAQRLLEQAATDDHFILVDTDPTHVADIVRALQTVTYDDVKQADWSEPKQQSVRSGFNEFQATLAALSNPQPGTNQP